MLSDKELLNFVISKCEELGVTAYEIAQNTSLSQMGALKILNGTSQNPRRKNLLIILNFLENKLVGSQLNEDRPPVYSSPIVTKSKVVPYYDIEIAGSSISSFEDASEFIRFYVDYEPLNDCTAFLPYSGDSMYPRYKSGDTLGVKEVRNFNIILWGETYLIITSENANSLKTVKTIHPHSDDRKLILRATNPDFVGDTVVDKSEILSLFLVKGKVELNQL